MEEHYNDPPQNGSCARTIMSLQTYFSSQKRILQELPCTRRRLSQNALVSNQLKSSSSSAPNYARNNCDLCRTRAITETVPAYTECLQRQSAQLKQPVSQGYTLACPNKKHTSLTAKYVDSPNPASYPVRFNTARTHAPIRPSRTTTLTP